MHNSGFPPPLVNLRVVLYQDVSLNHVDECRHLPVCVCVCVCVCMKLKLFTLGHMPSSMKDSEGCLGECSFSTVHVDIQTDLATVSLGMDLATVSLGMDLHLHWQVSDNHWDECCTV